MEPWPFSWLTSETIKIPGRHDIQQVSCTAHPMFSPCFPDFRRNRLEKRKHITRIVCASVCVCERSYVGEGDEDGRRA